MQGNRVVPKTYYNACVLYHQKQMLHYAIKTFVGKRVKVQNSSTAINDVL